MKEQNNTTKWRIASALLVIITVIGGTIAVVSWVAGSPTKPTSLQVVAAENFWGDIARQIGGNHVQVTSIISDPTADPHLYESNAQDAAAVGSAEVVITNGLGYDGFMDKLLHAANKPDRLILDVATIFGVHGADVNPHLWYNLSRVDLVADKLATSFEAKDPAHKIDYQRNLRHFEVSLQPLLATLTTIKQRYANTPVAFTEPVPAYLLTAAGLPVQTPPSFAKAIEDGTDPSPADTQAMNDLITNRQIKVLLYNSQATSPVTQHIESLAQQAGLPVIGVTETLPANQPSYQSWQQAQLNALLKALQS